MNPFKNNKEFLKIKEEQVEAPVHEIIPPSAIKIQNQIESGPAWRRKPDPNCERCHGVGIAGKVTCHCVTKKEYTPRAGNTIVE